MIKLSNVNQIRQCIDECHRTIGDLQSYANKSQDNMLKSTLTESAHHLDICIRECEFAAKQA